MAKAKEPEGSSVVRRSAVGSVLLLGLVAATLAVCDAVEYQPDARRLTPEEIALPQSQPASERYPFSRDG